MKYTNDSFSVAVGSKEYANNYERTFGKQYECETCDKKFRTHDNMNGVTHICPSCLDAFDRIP